MHTCRHELELPTPHYEMTHNVDLLNHIHQKIKERKSKYSKNDKLYVLKIAENSIVCHQISKLGMFDQD